MRKKYFSIVIAICVTGLFYILGRMWMTHQHSAREHISTAAFSGHTPPIQDNSATDSKEQATASTRGESPEASLITATGGALAKRLRAPLSEQDRAEIVERFRRPYSKFGDVDRAPENVEIAARLMILKHLARNEHKNQAPLVAFYKQILSHLDEKWIVQRRVLKNLAPHLPAMSEAQRDALWAMADTRARAHSATGDAELAQSYLESNDD